MFPNCKTPLHREVINIRPTWTRCNAPGSLLAFLQNATDSPRRSAVISSYCSDHGIGGLTDMSSKKRTILGIALLLMVGMGLYPPWVVSYSYPSGSVTYSIGYSFILSPPFSGL
jgi:hypothetical protein